VRVLGTDVLHGLPVFPEDVDANDSLAKLGIGRLHDVVVHVLRVLECVEACGTTGLYLVISTGCLTMACPLSVNGLVVTKLVEPKSTI
jgi:hypothetical protein